MFCEKCGKEIDDKAVMCPHCGAEFIKKNNNASNKWILGCLIAFLTPFIMLILMATVPSIITGKTGDEKKPNKPRLEVLETHNCKLSAYGGNAACGTVINNTNRTMNYVQVSINLYDMNDNQVGSTLANVNNLAPNTKWEFKAPIIYTGKYRWNVVDVKGF